MEALARTSTPSKVPETEDQSRPPSDKVLNTTGKNSVGDASSKSETFLKVVLRSILSALHTLSGDPLGGALMAYLWRTPAKPPQPEETSASPKNHTLAHRYYEANREYAGSTLNQLKTTLEYLSIKALIHEQPEALGEIDQLSGINANMHKLASKDSEAVRETDPDKPETGWSGRLNRHLNSTKISLEELQQKLNNSEPNEPMKTALGESIEKIDEMIGNLALHEGENFGKYSEARYRQIVGILSSKGITSELYPLAIESCARDYGKGNLTRADIEGLSHQDLIKLQMKISTDFAEAYKSFSKENVSRHFEAAYQRDYADSNKSNEEILLQAIQHRKKLEKDPEYAKQFRETQQQAILHRIAYESNTKYREQFDVFLGNRSFSDKEMTATGPGAVRGLLNFANGLRSAPTSKPASEKGISDTPSFTPATAEKNRAPSLAEQPQPASSATSKAEIVPTISKTAAQAGPLALTKNAGPTRSDESAPNNAIETLAQLKNALGRALAQAYGANATNETQTRISDLWDRTNALVKIDSTAKAQLTIAKANDHLALIRASLVELKQQPKLGGSVKKALDVCIRLASTVVTESPAQVRENRNSETQNGSPPNGAAKSILRAENPEGRIPKATKKVHFQQDPIDRVSIPGE